MATLDLSRVTPDMLPVARFATAAMHALAREERAGRKPRRLLEPEQATWRQFRGRMGSSELLLLLMEDAAVTQPFAFDARRLLGNQAGSVTRLPESTVTAWIGQLPALALEAGTQDYVLSQAAQLDLPTRLARSELHRGVRPHHRVLELPGTGGLLAAWLAEQVEGLYLQDVFTIAWQGWADRMLAGLVAVEHGLTGSAPIAAEPGLDGVGTEGARFDYVIGTDPARGLQSLTADALGRRFPGATVVLV